MSSFARGSRAHPRQSAKRVLKWAALVVLLGALLALVYLAGKGARANGRGVEADEATGTLTGRVAELESALLQAKQQLANGQTALDIEREASARVRSDLAEAQLRIGHLEQEVELYRGLLDSSVSRIGLAVHSLDIVPADVQGAYRFRIILVQRARKYGEIEGNLRLALRGRLAGEQRVLAYSEFGVPRGLPALPVRLRYFQVIEGSIELPSDFEPESLLIEVDVTKGGRQRLSERRDWNL